MTMFGEYSIFWCQLLYLGISISTSSLAKAHNVQIFEAHNVLKHNGMILKQACSIFNSERLGDRVIVMQKCIAIYLVCLCTRLRNVTTSFEMIS